MEQNDRKQILPVLIKVVWGVATLALIYRLVAMVDLY